MSKRRGLDRKISSVLFLVLYYRKFAAGSVSLAYYAGWPVSGYRAVSHVSYTRGDRLRLIVKC